MPSTVQPTESRVLSRESTMELAQINDFLSCIPLIASFIPTIIEQAAQSTRKLRVRIAWDERGQANKTLEIETYITAVPEAEEENQPI